MICDQHHVPCTELRLVSWEKLASQRKVKTKTDVAYKSRTGLFFSRWRKNGGGLITQNPQNLLIFKIPRFYFLKKFQKSRIFRPKIGLEPAYFLKKLADFWEKNLVTLQQARSNGRKRNMTRFDVILNSVPFWFFSDDVKWQRRRFVSQVVREKSRNLFSVIVFFNIYASYCLFKGSESRTELFLARTQQFEKVKKTFIMLHITREQTVQL